MEGEWKVRQKQQQIVQVPEETREDGALNTDHRVQNTGGSHWIKFPDPFKQKLENLMSILTLGRYSIFENASKLHPFPFISEEGAPVPN